MLRSGLRRRGPGIEKIVDRQPGDVSLCDRAGDDALVAKFADSDAALFQVLVKFRAACVCERARLADGEVPVFEPISKRDFHGRPSGLLQLLKDGDKQIAGHGHVANFLFVRF